MTKNQTKLKKNLIVVGDRVLVEPDENRERTSHGLYLPQGVEEKEKTNCGYVVKAGPGYPLADPAADLEEPWSTSRLSAKYLPLQVEEGDYVVFLRKSSIEIEFENQKYLIMPQSAILLIIRDDLLENFSEDDKI